MIFFFFFGECHSLGFGKYCKQYKEGEDNNGRFSSEKSETRIPKVKLCGRKGDSGGYEVYKLTLNRVEEGFPFSVARVFGWPSN